MGWNSIVPYAGAESGELQDTIGITKFSGANSTDWAQVIGGVIIQGGIALAVPPDGTVTINFQAPFTKQVLGVFTQSVYIPTASTSENAGLVNNVALDKFDLGNDGSQKDIYWWAIGV